MKKTLAAVAIALLLPMLTSAQVQAVPQTIGYQGRLLKSDGTPLNTKVTVTFRVYAQATGDTGLALWSEQQDVTPNSGGFYAVFLGAVTPFGASVFNGENRWLGLTIGTDGELIPRQKIGSVAYALRAGHAVTADSAASVTGGNVSTGAISASSLNLSGKGTSAATVAGDPANTMVTKGYVDAAPPDEAQLVVVHRGPTSNKEPTVNVKSLVILPNKLVVANFWLNGNGAGIAKGQPILTLPDRYAPRVPFEFTVSSPNCNPVAFHGVLSGDGIVTTNDTVIDGGCNYVFQMVYIAK